MGLGKYLGKFWTKILILLFVVSTAYLLMSYFQQSQRKDELQQKVNNLINDNANLAVSVAKRQTEASTEQLIVEQSTLETKIKAIESNLKESLISNDHVATLIQVARDEGVNLSSVKTSDLNNRKIEAIPFDVITLKIETDGSTSNVINFISHVCQTFQTGIVQNTGIQIREDPERGRLLYLSFDLDIYSYRD